MIPRGIWRTLDIGFDAALERLPAALAAEGFGVVTQIDITDTLKKKLGIDFRRYRIVGACNPGFAHQVLSRDPSIGLLLPCNFAVWEQDDGKVVLGAIDPLQTLGADGDAFADVAGEVKARLERVVRAV